MIFQGCRVSLYSSEPHSVNDCPTAILGNLTVNDQISLYSYPPNNELYSKCVTRVETSLSLLMISCLFDVTITFAVNFIVSQITVALNQRKKIRGM